MENENKELEPIVVDDEEVEKLSQNIMVQNKEAYEVLSK